MTSPLTSHAPDDWEVFALGDLFTFSNGVNADKSAYGSGAPFANVLEVITRESLDVGDIPGRIRLSNKLLDRFGVRHGDVLFNRTSETQDDVGLASVYLGEVPVVFGGFVLRGRPRTSKLDVQFSKYVLRGKAVRSQIVSRGQGGIRANIGQRDLSSVSVSLPGIPEQSAIASALDDVSELITVLRRQIVKKQAIKQGAMQQLLTGKRRLPGFTSPWEMIGVPDLLTRVNVKKHQVTTSHYARVGRTPIVDQGKLPIVGYTDRSDLAFSVGRDGVIVFGDHTCIVKFVSFDFVVGADGTQVLRARDGHSTRFLAYALELRPIASTGYNRHFKFLKEMMVSVPDRDEQVAIASALSEIDQDIAQARKRLAKAMALKQGMTQTLLSGRTRLPVEAAS